MDSLRVQQLKREAVERAIAGGKARLVRRCILENVVFYIALLAFLQVSGLLRLHLFVDTIMLAVVIAYSYLQASWRWKEMVAADKA